MGWKQSFHDLHEVCTSSWLCRLLRNTTHLPLWQQASDSICSIECLSQQEHLPSKTQIKEWVWWAKTEERKEVKCQQGLQGWFWNRLLGICALISSVNCQHNRDGIWWSSVEGKFQELLPAWHVSHSNEKDFRALFKISMRTTFPSTLFVLLGVGILHRAGKQRQRLRGLEWESHRKPKTFLMPFLKRICSCTHVLKCKAPVFFCCYRFWRSNLLCFAGEWYRKALLFWYVSLWVLFSMNI